MKIRYKFIIAFIIITVLAALPVSLFILERQEKDIISMLTHQGELQGKMLARSVLNTLLASGGDLDATRVDAGEFMKILHELRKDGLVSAQAVLLSKNTRYNGLLLARYPEDGKKMGSEDRLDHEFVNLLKNNTGYSKIKCPDSDQQCFQFVKTASLPGKKPLCLGRLLYSRETILAPVKQMRTFAFLATGAVVLMVSVLGLVFSRFFSKPIDRLTSAVSEFESGNMNYQVPVTSKDEIGKLANTFNHLTTMINMEISQLQTNNRDLKRLDHLKDEFLANISHELRTPLNGMIGLAESLLGGVSGTLTEDARHDLALITRSGQRLSYLVDDILDFSKLKNRDIKLVETTVNIHSVTKFVISILQPVIESKGLSVEVEIPDNGEFVKGDEHRIQQIMMNLIGNAVKFTEAGQISISSVKLPGKNNMVEIAVSDTGIGIPADRIERIFESFEQADGSDARRFGGTGLGLAITRKLVDLHGGDIRVKSNRGAGSVFYFTLPAAEPGETAGYDEDDMNMFPERFTGLFNDEIHLNLQKESTSEDEDPKYILLVDDDPVNLQVLINFLTMEGYKVDHEMSGDRVLEKIDTGQLPDLILLDVMLPRMSGYEVCRKIREKYSLHALPIMMLTAKTRVEDTITGLQAGANDYLSKPVNREELVARVRSLISMKKSVEEHDELNLIRRDIFIAHQIHHSVVIQQLPELAHIRVAYRYIPMQKMGGDFYDIIKIDENHTGVIMADVSGHGISAAIICAMLKMAFGFYQEYADQPGTLLTSINRIMYEYLESNYITGCYAFIDTFKSEITVANAGHWSPILIQETGIFTEWAKSLPIGWVQDMAYEETTANIHSGDRVVLYTDGVIETRNSEGTMFGYDNFQSQVMKDNNGDGELLVDNVVKVIRQWAELGQNEGFEDDVTIMVLDIA